jgi:hypothetical protein
MVLLAVVVASDINTIPTQTLPLKGRASERSASASGRWDGGSGALQVVRDRPLFSLPIKGRAGVGMVLLAVVEVASEVNTIPTQTLPLKGRASERAAPDRVCWGAVSGALQVVRDRPLFSLPFKGRAGVGMVLLVRHSTFTPPPHSPR